MKYLTVKQVAEGLGLHAQTVRKAVHAGRLRGRKIGRAWKFAESDVTAWVDGQWPATAAPADVSRT